MIARLPIYLKGQARDAYVDVMSKQGEPDLRAKLKGELADILMPYSDKNFTKNVKHKTKDFQTTSTN